MDMRYFSRLGFRKNLSLIESEVTFVKDMLYAGLGLVSAAVAAFFMYSYIVVAKGEAPKTMNFVIAIIFAIIALVCGVLFMSGRVNKNEEIHITE